MNDFAQDSHQSEFTQLDYFMKYAKRKFVKSHGGEVAKAVIEAAEDGGDKVWERTKGEGWIVYSQP